MNPVISKGLSFLVTTLLSLLPKIISDLVNRWKGREFTILDSRISVQAEGDEMTVSIKISVKPPAGLQVHGIDEQTAKDTAKTIVNKI